MVAYSPFKSFSYIQFSKDADDRTMLGGLKKQHKSTETNEVSTM